MLLRAIVQKIGRNSRFCKLPSATGFQWLTISVFVFSLLCCFFSLLPFISNDRVILRHWRRGGDAKPRCIAAVGHEDAKKYVGNTHERRTGHGEARSFFDPKHGPLGANFLGGTGPGPLEFLPANRYHTVSPTDRHQHLPSPLIYRLAIKFPSINVKRCNRVLVDARRSSINPTISREKLPDHSRSCLRADWHPRMLLSTIF